jgi:cupin fold WbuC family metalloprotein
MPLKLVTDDLLEALSNKAAASPRRRANENLHPELADPVQRFLNALEPGTYLRPHRHVAPAAKWELFVALRGSVAVLLFDDAGRVAARTEVNAQGPVRAVEVSPGEWHSLVALEPGTVVFEFKQGPYAATSDKDFVAWAPVEGAPGVARLVRAFEKAKRGDRPADAIAEPEQRKPARRTRRTPRPASGWKPLPGAYAMYVGPTRNATRKVLVLAEASGGWMFVEAVGQKGVNVRFSVKRSNLREPELDLFD